MGLFSKIGKAAKKFGKWTQKKAAPVIAKAAGVAAIAVNVVPGVGQVASAALAGVSAGAALLSKGGSTADKVGNAAELTSVIGGKGSGIMGNITKQLKSDKVLMAANGVDQLREINGYFKASTPDEGANATILTPVPPVTSVAVASKISSPDGDGVGVSPTSVSKAPSKSTKWWEVIGNMLGAGVKTSQDNGLFGAPSAQMQAAQGGFTDQMADSKGFKKYIIWGLGLLALIAICFGLLGRRNQQQPVRYAR